MERRQELIEIRQKTGLNRKEFAAYFDIPYRTMTDWELGNRQMPDYLLRLIAYKTRMEQLSTGEEQKKSSQNLVRDGVEYTFKRATLDDIDLLVETRILVLRAANELSDDTDMSQVEISSREYYMRALKEERHIAYLVMREKEFVGAGGVSFYQVMPTYHNPSGEKAYIKNMYTSPEYRRKGIAMHTLDLLVWESKKKGIEYISLEATKAGRPLYEKFGFVQCEGEMELC